MSDSVKKSKLYTKTGDSGTTSLYNGSRETKDSVYFECLGDLDELNCNLGMLKALFHNELEKSEIKLYNPPGAGAMFYKNLPGIDSGKYFEWFDMDNYITQIQCNVMDISSLIATPPLDVIRDINIWLSRVGVNNEIVNDIEKNIDRLDSLLPKITNFVLPSGNQLLCQIHICRAISRRGERKFLSVENHIKKNNLLENESIKQQYLIIRMYLNRLSDYLFVLSRFVGMTLNIKEDLYSKSKK